MLGLYFHLLALCVFVHIPPPSPQPYGPLPAILFTLLPTLASQSSSNSSFPSAITFLPVGFSLSFSLYPPSSLSLFSPQPLSRSPSLSHLALLSPFLLNPRISSFPILPRASFRRPHLFARYASPPTPTCVSLLFPLGSRLALAMGPIQFPASCNFQSIHKQLSSSKASTNIRIIAVRSNN